MSKSQRLLDNNWVINQETLEMMLGDRYKVYLKVKAESMGSKNTRGKSDILNLGTGYAKNMARKISKSKVEETWTRKMARKMVEEIKRGL